MFCRLTVYSEESVPLFGPPLPVPPVFSDPHEFRDFLLVKSKFLKSQSSVLKYFIYFKELSANHYNV